MMPKIISREEIVKMITEEIVTSESRNAWGVYARLSHYDALIPGYSMETQPEQTQEMAIKNGATTVRLFDDTGRSGKNSRRDGLQQLIYEIKAGRIDVVCVHRLDRSFRNLKSLLEFVDLLKKYKVRFISVTENIDTDTWWGRLVFVVLGSLAEAYLWQTSERTTEGLAKRRQAGLNLGRIPLGYCNGLCSTCKDENGEGYCPLHGKTDRPESERGRIMVPHPIDRYAISFIFDMYENGMSFREIANFLNNNQFELPDGSKVHFRPRGKRS